MANPRDIIILPDKQLRLISKPVETITPEIRTLVDDMFQTMYDAPGIGLAAIQVAVPLRLITMDLSKKEGEKEPRVFINPEILASSDELSVYEEGCLSIPNTMRRSSGPREYGCASWTSRENARGGCRGLYATCIQHEIDHLNGVLFVDYLSKLKRDRVMKKFTKAAKLAAK
jgi:peptide deformylase